MKIKKIKMTEEEKKLKRQEYQRKYQRKYHKKHKKCRGGHHRSNIIGTELEKNLKKANKKVVKTIISLPENNKYFTQCNKAILFSRICDAIDCENTHGNKKIIPDGGSIDIKRKDDLKRKFYLSCSVSEAKYQGSKGNADERLGQQILFVKELFQKYEINPHIIFCSGVGFKNENTTACAKWKMALGNIEFNKTYLNRPSVYIKEEVWTIDEMYSIILNLTKQSIEYYRSHKYL